jgi:pimeloyl-ACP methyl ester carboxylesterase
MPTLARDFEVIAADQPGIGLSDKPEQGYDTGSLANDHVGLMDALGRRRFAVVGVDTGMMIGYALLQMTPTGSWGSPLAMPFCRASRLPARWSPGAGKGPALVHPFQPAGRGERAACHRT